MNFESIISNTLFFPSIKNGIFDQNIPLQQNIKKFIEDQNTEASDFLFEYLCYNIIKKNINEINNETIIISDKYFSTQNCKQEFISKNATHKKNIVIVIQNSLTQKWDIVIFFDLESQIKKCMLEKENKSIKAKIISSNNENEDDDCILNSTMDKLENTFDFKSPEDIQFDVDSINISDQPNTSIFLLNFISGLIIQNNNDIQNYIQKLYDEGSSNIDNNNKTYFNSFNNKAEILNDLEKIYNSISESQIIKNGNDTLIKEKIENGNELTNNININNEIKDEIDLIQIEQDDDIEDDVDSDEEEALEIMKKENIEAKNQMREQERKLRQRLNKQKMRLKNMNMCENFGVIKEEENESCSESFEVFNNEKENKIKDVKEEIEFLKKSIGNLKKIADALNKKNNEENNYIKNKEINSKQKKQVDNEKDDKGIKISVLKNFEEAIQELEKENNNSNNSINDSINTSKQDGKDNSKIEDEIINKGCNLINENEKQNENNENENDNLNNKSLNTNNDNNLNNKSLNTNNNDQNNNIPLIKNNNNFKNNINSNKNDNSAKNKQICTLDSNSKNKNKINGIQIHVNGSENNIKNYNIPIINFKNNNKNSIKISNQNNRKKNKKSSIPIDKISMNGDIKNQVQNKKNIYSSLDFVNNEKNKDEKKKIKLPKKENSKIENMLEIEDIKEENGQVQDNNSESRTKKSTLIRRSLRKTEKTKLKLPPGKNNNYLSYNDYCTIDVGDTSKICGWCVAESNDSICQIF